MSRNFLRLCNNDREQCRKSNLFPTIFLIRKFSWMWKQWRIPPRRPCSAFNSFHWVGVGAQSTTFTFSYISRKFCLFFPSHSAIIIVLWTSPQTKLWLGRIQVNFAAVVHSSYSPKESNEFWIKSAEIQKDRRPRWVSVELLLGQS